MSIMQEYEFFKKEVGAQEWERINNFLNENEEYYLSDLIYNQAVYKIYEEWKSR